MEDLFDSGALLDSALLDFAALFESTALFDCVEAGFFLVLGIVTTCALTASVKQSTLYPPGEVRGQRRNEGRQRSREPDCFLYCIHSATIAKLNQQTLRSIKGE